MQPSKKIRSLCPQKWVQVLMMMMAILTKVDETIDRFDTESFLINR